MTGQHIRQCLHRGDRVYGTHVASLMNPVAAAMAADMDLDFAFICTEHMPVDRTEVSMMCRYYTARGISPIVRVPTVDPAAIGGALDGGAEGIVTPYVETVEEVRKLVGAVKHRPIKGQQLQDVLAGRCELPAKTRQFLDTFNRDHYLIIGIESVAGIERLESLITVDGVDGVFLGPHDITVSMGIPGEYEHPNFIAQIEDVVRRCRRHHVGVGLHTLYLNMQPEDLRRLLDAGMNWLINGADISLMCQAMNEQLRRLREMTGDTAPPTQTSAPAPVASCITA